MLAACGRPADTLTVAGTVEVRQVQLSPLTSGRILRILKDEGDSVRTGDTVAVLEQPGLSALIEQRRAQADAAASRTAEIRAAEADSQRASNDLSRSGVVSAQQFDALASAAAAAAARLQAVRGSVRESQAARAGVAAIEATRDQLTLVAPDAGIVLTRYAEPGEAIGAGTPVISIGVVRRPWVRAFVGERYVARVTLGQTVRVRVDGYPDTAFIGRLVDIASRAEFTPRAALTERERADLVFGIKIELDSTAGGGRLRAGMPVEVELPLRP